MQVVVLRGPSGAGKSTWVSKTHPTAVVCSADKFFLKQTEEGIVYQFDPTKLGEAHAHSLKEFLQALHERNPVIVVDNTNTRIWEFENYIYAAKLVGAKINVVEFRARTVEDIRICIRRNVHKVPTHIIAQMCVDFEDCHWLDRNVEVVPLS